MKIAVIGSGAMGCLYGAYLSEKNQVIMIDSYRPQAEAIARNGIRVVETDGSEKIYKERVSACLSGECREEVELVIVFVKSTATEAALEENKALFGESTFVLTLQNGAGNDRKVAKYVRAENILVGTSKHNAVNLGNGATRHGGSGATTIGSNAHCREAVDKVAAVFRESGLLTETSDDIQRIIWSKLFVNLSVNAFTAITETPIGYLAQNAYAWNFAKRLIYEAVEVAEADGTYFDRREVLEMVRKVCVDDANGYSSMYQDRKRRIKTEIDAINGAVVEQAKLYGVPTPYNAIIVDLIHAIEGAYDLYD